MFLKRVLLNAEVFCCYFKKKLLGGSQHIIVFIEKVFLNVKVFDCN